MELKHEKMQSEFMIETWDFMKKEVEEYCHFSFG